MKDTRHARRRWHDQLVHRGWGADTRTPEFDPCELPKRDRRELAVQLAAQAFDLEYLEHRYSVKLRPKDFDPEQLSVPEKRTICNAFAARGESVDKLEATFGITRKTDA